MALLVLFAFVAGAATAVSPCVLPVLPVALGLVIGGSVSNLIDRIRLGYVTDFLDLRYWPAFNLADSFIVIGVALLVYALFAAERTPTRLSAVGDVNGR